MTLVASFYLVCIVRYGFILIIRLGWFWDRLDLVRGWLGVCLGMVWFGVGLVWIG